MIASVQKGAVYVQTVHFNQLYIWMISISAALGGLLFGYDWVVIGGAKIFFERFFLLTDASSRGWANSCALIGCFIGAVFAGWLSDKFGRKQLLILSAFLFMFTSVGIGFSQVFIVFVLWRVFGGVAIGLASSLAPMYIAETAPAHMRGRLVSINQLTIVIGILAAQLINYLIAKKMPDGMTETMIFNSWNVREGWRWMFGATAVPALIFLVSSIFIPESPRWLAKNGRNKKAKDILAKIGGKGYAEKALIEIEETLVNDSKSLDLHEFFKPNIKKILLLGIVLAVFQQWCGINVIFNYAEEIFKQAGYNISGTLVNIAWTGSINLIFTLFAISVVDRKGRRFLMLIGSGGLAIIYVGIGLGYFFHLNGLPMLLLVLAAIGTYGMSLAPITWVVISEIFPNRIRGSAMSVAVASLWIACFILTFTFPILNTGLGAAKTFWIYSLICIGGFIFIYIKLPETKGKTLEQIEKDQVA
ncbi:MAG: sugar porter family MFS transporter [Ignavibacteriaceae bacterium]